MAKVIRTEMNLPTLIEMDEEKCRVYLTKTRWENGIECPRCGSHRISKMSKYFQYTCRICKYEFSVTAQTSFHNSSIPLLKQFIIVYLLLENKDGIPTAQIARMLNISYKASWFTLMRIRNAMKPTNQRKLKGVVEVDEFYFGGSIEGMGAHYTKNKAHVVGAIERGGEVRLQIIQRADGKTLRKFIEDNVEPTAKIMTDEWRGYNRIERETVNHHLGEYCRGDVHTGTIDNFIGTVKKSVYQHTDYFQSYLDELVYKHNNRNNFYIFRDTLRLMLNTAPLTYDELVHQQREEVNAVSPSYLFPPALAPIGQ